MASGITAGTTSSDSLEDLHEPPEEQLRVVWTKLVEHNQLLFATRTQTDSDSLNSGNVSRTSGTTESQTAATTTTASSATTNTAAAEPKKRLLPKRRGKKQKESSDGSSNSNNNTRQWPTYDKVLSDMSSADYKHTLTCPMDLVRPHPGKTLCPHGVVGCVKVELFPLPPGEQAYSGLLTPGTTLDHCLMRLSSATSPPNHEIKGRLARAVLFATGEKLRSAQLFPSCALKVFRHHQRSGNLLFGGSKVGQRQADYFAHCQATCMTEQMPRTVKPFVRKFWEYSNYPLSLGTSDFCAHDAAGQPSGTTDWNFPFCVILKPLVSTADLVGSTRQQPQSFADSFHSFLDVTLHHVKEGQPLFDLYACPTPFAVPDPAQLQRIGRITLTSPFMASAPNDGLFFRHQLKEEDYRLRPTWKAALGHTISMDQGKTKGTIGKLAGWKLFEQHLQQDQFVDYEALYQQVSSRVMHFLATEPPASGEFGSALYTQEEKREEG